MSGMMTEAAFYTSLKNRGLVKISGPDRFTFLQGLITNDVSMLTSTPCMYACLLTPQGKFLYDFFMTQRDEAIWLDCEGGTRAQDLEKHLSLYKLRANIRMECTPSVPVYALWGHDLGTPDPRHKDMGYRSFEIPEALEEKQFSAWDERRIRLCIPDGSRDMIAGQSTLLECGIDHLNGVSFDKGCYMGQELTARTHYRGLIKKHLYAVEANILPDSGESILIDGRIIGEMRSSSGRIGLALLRDEEIGNLTEIKVIASLQK